MDILDQTFLLKIPIVRVQVVFEGIGHCLYSRKGNVCYVHVAFRFYMTEEANCARNYSATLSRVTTN